MARARTSPFLAAVLALALPAACGDDSATADPPSEAAAAKIKTKKGAAADSDAPTPVDRADRAEESPTPDPPDTPPDLPAEPETETLTEGGWLEGTIKPGDALGSILRRGGMASAEIQVLIEALSPHVDPTKIQPGQRYRWLPADSGPGIDAFEFVQSRERSIRVTRQDDDTWKAEQVDAATELRVTSVAGTVESSLSAAVSAAGERAALVSLIVDTFAYDINFYTDTRKGDTFKVVVERVELDGEFIRYGRMLAAEYKGSAAGERRMYWWEGPKGKAAGYYDDDGRGVARTFLKSPLKFTRISSKFNPKRMHPILHRVKGHMGTDYAAPEGTPVWAAASGTISLRERRGGAGNMVIIRHADGLTTLYMHLSKFARGQRVGQRVEQKTVIGYVGSTGLATGPHLHFGVKRNGRYVDPQSVGNSRSSGIPKKYRDGFEKHVKPLRAQLDALTVESAKSPTPADSGGP